MQPDENTKSEPLQLLEAPKEKVPWWAWAGFVLLCLIVIYAIVNSFLNKENRIPAPATIVEALPSPYENLELEAKAVVVWDIANQKVLFSKNADEALPLASLTKVMAGLVASDLIPSFTTITIEKEFLDEEGDTGLYANERWSFRDLANFSLAVSSNDGMRAIASVAGAVLSNTTGGENFDTGRSAFVDKMNEKGQKIGLAHTTYENETGLDLTTETGGAHGTAQDMAKLFEYTLTYYPELLETTRQSGFQISSLSNLSHTATNTNPYVHFIPGIIASKTGFTDLSQGNLVIAFNPELNRPIVVSVLGSSYDGRFLDTLKLVDSTMQVLERETSF